MVNEKNETGNIQISDNAIANIAAIAAKSINGVVDLDGGAVSGIADMLGVKNETKGIKVELRGENVAVDINLIVAFGNDISNIASLVQEKVKESIENMTGLNVEKVNVNINSIKNNIKKEEKK
ncbi:MAG: Asp23/Gls24 family envelope stress response protein [Candidatus Goldbacteria bacterium]|nr:Asp23/Gls24 family envelope stress response protein [Candidatus Goldiibacteriota bacterium]